MGSWMMTCYMNIDANGVKEAQSGGQPSAELQQELFSQRPDRPQQVQQASRRQWELLESVLMEQQEKQKSSRSSQSKSQGSQSSQQQSQGGSPQGGPQVVGAGMSGQPFVIYIAVVFGAI